MYNMSYYIMSTHLRARAIITSVFFLCSILTIAESPTHIFADISKPESPVLVRGFLGQKLNSYWKWKKIAQSKLVIQDQELNSIRGLKRRKNELYEPVSSPENSTLDACACMRLGRIYRGREVISPTENLQFISLGEFEILTIKPLSQELIIYYWKNIKIILFNNTNIWNEYNINL